jgi:hypothetical protein
VVIAVPFDKDDEADSKSVDYSLDSTRDDCR